MEFRDLKTQYRENASLIDAQIKQVLQAGNFIGGEQVKELEDKLAEYVGKKYCISCANGTDALQLALMAWEIKQGDAVFVPDFTFFSSAEVIAAQGATPIFVDICPETYNISADNLEKAVEKVLEDGKLRPRAVIAVDLFGLPAEYEKIRTVAGRYYLKLLEDGAQGFGGKIGEKRACSFGDISTTSFFPAKPLGCYGDGGAVFTDDEDIAKLIGSYKVHGKGTGKYDNVRIGMNSRLDTIQAAVLLAKLSVFEDFELNQVNRVAQWYTKELDGCVEVPVIPVGYTSSWAQYSIKLKTEEERDRLKAELGEKGIPAMIYYTKPMHLQTAFVESGCGGGSYPVSEDICKRVLSLPMHPYLKKDEVERICVCIQQIVKR
jgi:dTDP-4-amino-4,6-dideoxygalactose transaminase